MAQPSSSLPENAGGPVPRPDPPGMAGESAGLDEPGERQLARCLGRDVVHERGAEYVIEQVRRQDEPARADGAELSTLPALSPRMVGGALIRVHVDLRRRVHKSCSWGACV